MRKLAKIAPKLIQPAKFCSRTYFKPSLFRFQKDGIEDKEQKQEEPQTKEIKTEDLIQETEDLIQETEDLIQETEDLIQKTEDLIQETKDLIYELQAKKSKKSFYLKISLEGSLVLFTSFIILLIIIFLACGFTF